jgi:ribosomal protein L11 methyltransferase
MNSEMPTTLSDTTLAMLVTDEQSAHRVADAFADGFLAAEVAASIVDAGREGWRLSLHFRGAPDEKAIRALAARAAGNEAGRALRFARIAAKDWVRESLLGLKPIAAGRFIVHGAHDRALVPLNKIGIEIEAGLAFGTGNHGTTRGCLLALDALCKPQNGGRRKRTPFRRRNSTPRHVLDLGAGTGVLAIAAARALRLPILATDIDANAVGIARKNARFNRAGAKIRICRANGVAAPAIRLNAPFVLVFANILLAPLQKLSSPLTRLLAPGGRIVLSGVLASQANAVLAAYHEFALEWRIVLDGWTTLVLKRGPAVARHERRP